MSRNSPYWYDPVVRALLRNRNKIDRETEHGATICAAIDRALAETACLDHGDLRIRLVEMLYFKKTHTFYGAASALYISPRTAQRYDFAFKALVAKYSGFTK